MAKSFDKGVNYMISTKGRYGLRVMIDLAKNDNGSYIPLKDIADRQEISKKYLEIIVKKMKAVSSKVPAAKAADISSSRSLRNTPSVRYLP